MDDILIYEELDLWTKQNFSDYFVLTYDMNNVL